MIAVICSNIIQASEWVRNNNNIALEDKANRIFITHHGTKFVLIMTQEQALSYEFSGYQISPDYYSFIDLVKSRVK